MEIRDSLTASKQTPVALLRALSSSLGSQKTLGLQAPKASDTLLTPHKLPKCAPVTSASKGKEGKSCPVSPSKTTTETQHKPLNFSTGSDRPSSRATSQLPGAACVSKEPGCSCRSQEQAQIITNKCKAQLQKRVFRVFKKKHCWKSGAACPNTLRNKDQYWYLFNSLLVCISAGEAVEQQRGFFLSAEHPKGRRSGSPIPGGAGEAQGTSSPCTHSAAAAAPQSSGPR